MHAVTCPVFMTRDKRRDGPAKYKALNTDMTTVAHLGICQLLNMKRICTSSDSSYEEKRKLIISLLQPILISQPARLSFKRQKISGMLSIVWKQTATVREDIMTPNKQKAKEATDIDTKITYLERKIANVPTQISLTNGFRSM